MIGDIITLIRESFSEYRVIGDIINIKRISST